MKSPFVIPPDGRLQNIQIPPFPFDGICSISIDGSAPFSYQLYCPGTGTDYSDKPILCKGKKELLPFSSSKGMIFCFDFWGRPGTEILPPQAEFNIPFNVKYYSFREYTLDGLYRKTPIEIKAGEETEVSLTNFRGGHYEIHKVYSAINKRLSCKIKYHNKIIESFHLENDHSFKKPWILNWPDSAMLYIKNESSSDLEILPTDIYFAGYLIKPTEKEIKPVASINARNTFLIEGINLR